MSTLPPYRRQNPRICRIIPGPIALMLLMGFSAIGQESLTPAKAAQRVEKTTGEPILWLEPNDIANRDLYYGEGGEMNAPHGNVFAFVKEDLSGTNPKLVVTDLSGIQWKIKLGAEAKPEIAATRFVWAAGYFTNEDYFLPELKITGLPAKLHRGRRFVAGDGTVQDARMQRMDKSESKLGNWQWKRGAFAGTREWNGLRVLMALINNWDLKDMNNKVTVEKRPSAPGEPVQETYFVSDLGGSFGTTGIVMGLGNSRGNLKAFKSSKFITKVTPQYVDFATPSRATLMELMNPPQFLMRLHLRWIGRRIPRQDVEWMAGILARLSRSQIRDAFRAAGFAPQEVEGFAAVMEKRISSLNDI